MRGNRHYESQLTLGEVQLKRDGLEDAIKTLLERFLEETTVAIDSVEIVYGEIYGNANSVMCVRAELKI